MSTVWTYRQLLRRLDRWIANEKAALRLAMCDPKEEISHLYLEGRLCSLSATRLYLRKFSAEAGLTVFDSEGDKDELR